MSLPDQLIHSALYKPKAKWCPDEDEILLQAVRERGPSRWNELAAALPGRTGKQCRERWLAKLCPAFTSDPWTPEEDGTLIRLQGQYGNVWAKFRAELPHRSTTAVKNRWVSLRRKRIVPVTVIAHVPSETDVAPLQADALGVVLVDLMSGDFDWSL